MKVQLRSMLLFLGGSLIILAGFRNVNQRGGNKIPSKNQPEPVTIEFIYTGVAADGSLTGTFTAEGGIEASGTTEMDVNEFGNVAHCSQTLQTPEGTLTFLSNCQFSTMTGTWRIVSGSGAFAGINGNGKLQMTFPGGGIIVIESFSGKVR